MGRSGKCDGLPPGTQFPRKSYKCLISIVGKQCELLSRYRTQQQLLISHTAAAPSLVNQNSYQKNVAGVKFPPQTPCYPSYLPDNCNDQHLPQCKIYYSMCHYDVQLSVFFNQLDYAGKLKNSENSIQRKNRSPKFCPLKRGFPLFQRFLCTRNQKWLPRFSKECPLNCGFPLYWCPLNRASTVLSSKLIFRLVFFAELCIFSDNLCEFRTIDFCYIECPLYSKMGHLYGVY